MLKTLRYRKNQQPVDSGSADSTSLENSEKNSELNLGEYRVKEGDTLTQITKEIGYKEASFTKMMNAIYSINPQAFSKNSKSLLKAGAILKIPSVQEVLGIKPLEIQWKQLTRTLLKKLI